MLYCVFLLSLIFTCAVAPPGVCSNGNNSACNAIDSPDGVTADNTWSQSIDVATTTEAPGFIQSISLYLYYGDVTSGTVTKSLTITIDGTPTVSEPIEFTGEGKYTFVFTGGLPYTASSSLVFQLPDSDLVASAVLTDTCFGQAEQSLKRTTFADILYEMVVSCDSSSTGDPHFYGFKGQKYDVMGQSFEIYNIISAPYLQLNSKFIPYYKTSTQIEPTGTMIGDLGFQFNGNKFYINSNSTLGELNGQIVSMTSDWKLTFGDLVLSNVVTGRMYELSFSSADITITFIRKVYKITHLEDQWHFDYRAHINIENENFHGLLGQTWENKLFSNKEGAFKFLDGFEDDYRIKSANIFGNDFKFNKYQAM